MKSLLALALLTFSLSSMAGVIRCDGEETYASVELLLPGSPSSIGQGEYSFKDKVIPSSLNSYGILSSTEEQTQSIVYKFTTQKKHKLALKGSMLALKVKQSVVNPDPFSFKLNDKHEATLTLEEDGKSVLLDKLNCRELSI